jgi:putative restriction endonuclease
MSEYAIIVQNDESKWDDKKGDSYNYPKRYRNILTRGCKIVYYKGKLREERYSTTRLSPDPHYFGIGIIGDSTISEESELPELYCEILNYKEFQKPVPIKINDEYLEPIPKSRETNYWRFGVREINKETYNRILSYARIKEYHISMPNENEEFESYQWVEGKKKIRFSSYYERNPFYRNKAIEIHGLTCMVCNFNFESKFGSHGKGYIHVHHNKPIHESGPIVINPETDMSVLCPNCHAMIHRNKELTLTLDELRSILDQE